MRPCFARPEPWLQAGKYLCALAGGLARRNGWTIAEHAGDRAPDKTQRLLSRAVWDTDAAMGTVRRFAVAGLAGAARRGGRRGTVIGALDETGQEKAGTATAGVQRQYLSCAGKVANGINTVHLAYVREHAGHALIGARQWIPGAQIADPARSFAMGLPPDLEFRTKGQLAIDITAEVLADGVCFDFFCGDEVYGSCTQLREFLEDRGQAYVLRVPRNFRLTLPGGQRLTCADAASQLAPAGHGERGRAARLQGRTTAAAAPRSRRGTTGPALPRHRTADPVRRRSSAPGTGRPCRCRPPAGPTPPRARSRPRRRPGRAACRPG